MAQQPASNPEGAPNGQIVDRNLFHLALIIIVGIFATTMPQPQVLGRFPLLFLLKDTLHHNQEEIATFFFWCGLAWYFKPFAGILTDAFPLFKTRRRHYILISSVCSCASWIYLANVKHEYSALLYACIIVNFFMVITSTVIGAFLVEAGQAMGATGRLTSVRQVVSNVCSLITGPLGGFLASGAFAIAAGVNAALILSIFPVVYFFLREKRQEVTSSQAFENAGRQLRIIFKSRSLWFAILFIGLFYFAPGFGTPLVFRQSDVLHFSKQTIGNLGICGSLAGILAALLYGKLIRMFNLRVLIFVGVTTCAVGTLLYLFYGSVLAAIFIDGQNGFFFTLCEVALLDLAARATPKGCEGLGYSLILSMRNLAIFGADIVGSKLAVAKWEFHSLVLLNAGTTALVLVLVPFLPAVLMMSKDREASAA